MSEREWYKKDGFWRLESKDWEEGLYGFKPEGLGDLISNTCMKIIEDGDTSSWALGALVKCIVLLRERKRWPDEYNNEFMHSNRVVQFLYNLSFELGYSKKVKYRCQKSLTRDPFIYVFCLSVHLGKEDYIKEVRIPWYLFNPAVFSFRRGVISKRKVWRGVYKLFTLIPPSWDYTKRMRKYMDTAVEKIDWL